MAIGVVLFLFLGLNACISVSSAGGRADVVGVSAACRERVEASEEMSPDGPQGGAGLAVRVTSTSVEEGEGLAAQSGRIVSAGPDGAVSKPIWVPLYVWQCSAQRLPGSGDWEVTGLRVEPVDASPENTTPYSVRIS